MEFLNKIELRGLVGNVSMNKVGEQTCARFSVCTETSYRNADGSFAIECTWINCTAWSGKCPNVSELGRNKQVHLLGRIRTSQYITAEGTERTIYEVFVNSLEIIN